VQIVNVLSDDLVLKVLPWTFANALASVDGRLAISSLGTQIGAPGFSARTMALGVTSTVKAQQPAAPRQCDTNERLQLVHSTLLVWISNAVDEFLPVYALSSVENKYSAD
jgi:hypothetical protein